MAFLLSFVSQQFLFYFQNIWIQWRMRRIVGPVEQSLVRVLPDTLLEGVLHIFESCIKTFKEHIHWINFDTWTSIWLKITQKIGEDRNWGAMCCSIFKTLKCLSNFFLLLPKKWIFNTYPYYNSPKIGGCKLKTL